jgi:hypothetical protein
MSKAAKRAPKQKFGCGEISCFGVNFTRIAKMVTTTCETNAMFFFFVWLVFCYHAEVRWFASCREVGDRD